MNDAHVMDFILTCYFPALMQISLVAIHKLVRVFYKIVYGRDNVGMSVMRLVMLQEAVGQ